MLACERLNKMTSVREEWLQCMICCCLLPPQCEALRTCRSGFPIATKWCCDRDTNLGCPWQLPRPLYCCLFAPHICRCCSSCTSCSWWIAHSTHATTSPTFYNEPHRSHVLFVKAAPGTTFTSWSQHHMFTWTFGQRKSKNNKFLQNTTWP